MFSKGGPYRSYHSTYGQKQLCGDGLISADVDEATLF